MNDRLKAIQEKRAGRQAKLADESEDTLAADLEAIDALEIEHGDASVGVLEFPYLPGCVMRAAVRTPEPAEIKRYRAQVKLSKKAEFDATKHEDAIVLLGKACQIYPEAGSEADDTLREKRPDVDAQLGSLALGLAKGREAAEGKDS